MPWTVCRLYGCRLMAFAQVGRQAEGSVGDRGCPLVSAGACPRYAPSRDLLGRAEPETSIPGGILAEPAASRVCGPGWSRLRTSAATKQDGRHLVGTARRRFS